MSTSLPPMIASRRAEEITRLALDQEAVGVGIVPLPEAALALFLMAAAPPRVVVHGRLVHDVADRILRRLEFVWPVLDLDVEQVRIGAAIHDIGKFAHPGEWTSPTNAHRAAGIGWLLSNGVTREIARCTVTHAAWTGVSATVEDRLIAMADRAWKGVRIVELEAFLVADLVAATDVAAFEVFDVLEDLITEVCAGGDRRVVVQGQFATTWDI